MDVHFVTSVHSDVGMDVISHTYVHSGEGMSDYCKIIDKTSVRMSVKIVMLIESYVGVDTISFMGINPDIGVEVRCVVCINLAFRIVLIRFTQMNIRVSFVVIVFLFNGCRDVAGRIHNCFGVLQPYI